MRTTVVAHPNLNIINNCLLEASPLSEDASFQEVYQQIPTRPDYKIDFSNYRKSSHTLLEQSNIEIEIQRLNSAHQELISENLKPFDNSADLFKLNQLVVGSSQESKRTELLQGPYEFPSPTLIDQGLKLLQDFYQHSTAHPFIKQVALMQAVLSLHPFADGNHRTARLMMDTHLVQTQRPAMTILKPSDLIFANPIHSKYFSLEKAVQAVLHGIGESLR